MKDSTFIMILLFSLKKEIVNLLADSESLWN